MKTVWDWEDGWAADGWAPFCLRWLERDTLMAASIIKTGDDVYMLEIYTSISISGIYYNFNSLEAAKSFGDEAIRLLGYRTLQNHLKALL